MSEVSSWDPVDDANTAAPPNGWPEFMQPSAVNNTARAMMGAVRRWYDTVVTQLAAINAGLGNKVSKTGDTMTGGLTISAANAVFALNKAGASSVNEIYGNNAGVTRWIFRLGGWGEGGSNTGSDVEFHRYADNGAYLGQAMGISRASGEAFFSNALTLSTGASAAQHATRKDYVDQRDTDWYNLAWSNITSWANTQDIAHYNNSVNYTNTAVGDRVWKGGDTMTGPLLFTGTAGGMAISNDSAASRHFYQFVTGVAVVYEIDTGRTLFVHPGAPPGLWIMYGPCIANVSYVGGHGAYVDLSDASLKEQIEPAGQGLAEILQLQPKTFIRKQRMEGLPQRRELGFVAQDVQATMPLAVVEVDTKEGPPLLGVASEAIVAAMVTAIKQLNERIEVLEGRT